ncbi:hypothetical protein MDOR_34820 [Mycolicibacterium doricum]|uniref:Uncharacterized protein n=1 Tax=Mycolicibacterium doricum TaxID=126673 RepID=A0A1X1T2L9_9MYCO|nr:hypothetical protein AWC01_14570 [Mycolicibacterium doricum]BBZ09313.1 hypothetical protein MDOR_34820 [Mycolicibacterium doricum]
MLVPPALYSPANQSADRRERPSDAGIAAVDAASAALRVRQAGRIAGQAGDLSAASAGYDDTDRSNAADISATV